MMCVNSSWSSLTCLAGFLALWHPITITCQCHGLTLSPSIPMTASPTVISPITNSIVVSSDSYTIASFESGARSWLRHYARSTTSPLPSAAVSTSHSNLAFFQSSQMLLSLDDDIDTNNEPEMSSSWDDQIIQTSKQKPNSTTSKSKNAVKIDKVERILDSSTIRLQSGGNVSLQTVRGAGSTYRLPECMTYAPAYKLKQLLPKGTNVRYFSLTGDNVGDNDAVGDGRGNGSGNAPKVWIVRDQDDLLVNRELVKSGYAFVRKGDPSVTFATSRTSNFGEMMMNELKQLEEDAKSQGLGIFKVCDEGGIEASSSTNDDATTTMSSNSAPFVAEFEPLEFTTTTQWGDDGGKSILVSRDSNSYYSPSNPPPNPGDIKGCSDFETYEDALSWYEKYAPYYGDVAKLDRDGDGVPCPGLPHTSVRERYRMKLPNGSVGVGGVGNEAVDVSR